jgi:hypothetical protein
MKVLGLEWRRPRNGDRATGGGSEREREKRKLRNLTVKSDENRGRKKEKKFARRASGLENGRETEC